MNKKRIFINFEFKKRYKNDIKPSENVFTRKF